MFKNENQTFKNSNSQEEIIDSLNKQSDFDPSSLKHYISKKNIKRKKNKKSITKFNKM